MTTEPPVLDIARPAAGWADALPEAEDLARRAVAAALDALSEGEDPGGAVEVSLVLADDAMVHQLNSEWRGRDAPTNVLSFPATDGGAGYTPPGEALVLGDVVVALETTTREAADAGRSLSHHFSHLVVHGMLHLLGFDHQDEAEAEEMERLEVLILAGLGIADPYQQRDEP